jgi:hypothetical protein
LHGKPVDAIATALTTHNIPYAFVSGHSRAGLPVAFANAPLVSKPFSHAQIVDAISKLLQRHSQAALLKS